jgi:cytoskeleton protein RodZ
LSDAATGGLVSEIGAELSRARAARGLSLDDVAQQLKFAPRQIDALERDRFDLLPGSTFARGMVRSYARLLKVDPGPLVERMAGRVEVPDAEKLAARYSEPVPFSDSTRRSTLVYFGVSLGILALVGVAAYEWRHERGARQDLVSTMPPQALAQAPAPVLSDALAAMKEPAAPAPAAQDAAKAEPGARRLVLRIEEEAWIEVKDGADRLLISSLNPAGTERVVQGRPPFSLVIGNAQHVRVLYEDRPVDLQPYVKVEVARFTLK